MMMNSFSYSATSNNALSAVQYKTSNNQQDDLIMLPFIIIYSTGQTWAVRIRFELRKVGESNILSMYTLSTLLFVFTKFHILSGQAVLGNMNSNRAQSGGVNQTQTLVNISKRVQSNPNTREHIKVGSIKPKH